MNAPADSHTPTTPAADVVPDYGTMNRELLAEKLATTYFGADLSLGATVSRERWLAVVDVAIAELQGAS